MKPVASLSPVMMLLWVVVWAGCGGSPSPSSSAGGDASSAGTDVSVDPGPPPEGQSEPTASEPLPVPPPQAPAVTLRILDWAGVEEIIASHRGKVVVVDLWSTGCIPCRREFPHLVKLHRELGERVACVSVSTDYDGIPSKPPETYRETVLEFLTQQGATFDNVLCSVAAEELFDQLKIGSIPAVFVYNQAGELVQWFTEPVDGQEFTYAGQIRPYVESLLAGE
jgi:thiol-disulfide isomerase/thioredoxin